MVVVDDVQVGHRFIEGREVVGVRIDGCAVHRSDLSRLGVEELHFQIFNFKTFHLFFNFTVLLDFLMIY